MPEYRFTNTLTVELAALHKEWPKICSATGLFWWGTPGKVNPTLKIRASGIKKEFTDTENYGRYVDGWLFYGDLKDLVSEPDQVVHYTVNVNAETPKAIRVDFFGIDPVKHTEAKPFAKFLCKNSSVPMPDQNFERKGTGIWRGFDSATCSATLFKRRNERTVEMYAHALKKKIAFDMPQDTNFVDSLHYTGTFTFFTTNDLLNGKTCILNFGEDRIAYFAKELANDTMSFYPYEGEGLLPVAFYTQQTAVGTWSDVN